MSFKSFFPTIFIILLFQINSCKSRVKETEVRQYKLGMQDNNSKYVKAFEKLVKQFNQSLDNNILTFTNNPGEINSTITITKGLNDKTGKIGYGQWIEETKDEGISGIFNDGKIEREKVYTMALEFDEQYIETRVIKNDTQSWYDLEKAFTHEAGHGLGYGHVNTQSHIMYPEISGAKDLNGFFSEIRRDFKLQ